jgi:hypothetical protein
VRRQAIIAVSEQAIHSCFNVPKGFKIRHMFFDELRMCLCLVVESDTLDPVPDGVYLPGLETRYRVYDLNPIYWELVDDLRTVS